MEKSAFRGISRSIVLVCMLFVCAAAGMASAETKALGKWEVTIKFNEREMVTTLSITQGKGGAYAAAWERKRREGEQRRGETNITDVKVEGNKISFTMTSKYGENEWTSSYAGTIEGDKLTGKLTSERGEIDANGVRVKPAVFGNWEFTSQGRGGGSRTRLLVLKEDMTGTYQMRDSDVAIKDFKVDGNAVSFKIDMSYGQNSFTMEYKGKLTGEELKGEWITPRGSREAVGKRAGTTIVVNAEEAAAGLEKMIAEAKKTGTIKEIDNAVAIIEAATRSMDKMELFAKLDTLQSYRKDVVLPSPKKALTDSDKLDWAILNFQVRQLRNIPAEQVKAHPAAAEFPGAIDDDVKRIKRKVTITTDRPGWRNRGIYGQTDRKDMQSTGLYAAPGELITVTVPTEAAAAGLNVRIGVHRDTLWGKKSLKRAPEICRVFDITSETTMAANAFGGPIYIDTPHDCALGKFKVKIENAVAMPRYIAGKTKPKQWLKIRNNPAPWAEFETDKVVFTLASEHVRSIDDPTEIVKFWDGVMDSCADLLGKKHDRKRAERFATDIQISAGYMHSGYPLMAGLDIGSTMLDIDRIKKNGHGGVWGLFHEIGHNHQNSLWVYRGTTEVTVNLFSLYVFEKMCGLYPKDKVHSGALPENREKSLKKYLAEGAKFDKWQSNPFLALYMYSMIQEEFGWEPMSKVFKEYREESKENLPKNDDQKRDQWMVRLSKATGKNLGPFFDAWGVPVSDDAKQQVASLPKWMPKDFPEVKVPAK
ncbi:MAG: M60 family metallopeptidase [Anaerohalosphaera sp.]|nr:M60 family metallopeptidase [Anaerohalosphaera sp.]